MCGICGVLVFESPFFKVSFWRLPKYIQLYIKDSKVRSSKKITKNIKDRNTPVIAITNQSMGAEHLVL